jgi:A-factor type gamma-butyrolactone 1'-reductase (1S-forming)
MRLDQEIPEIRQANKEDSVEKDRFLSGKTAIVTGAISGIGHATAATLARAGAAVVIHARRVDRLDKVTGEIAPHGGRALSVAGH